MKNTKLLILGGLDVIGDKQLFIRVTNHEPTLKEKEIFLEETVKKYANENNLYPVSNLKLENIKVIDCEDKIIPIDELKVKYFSKIKL